MLTKEGALQKIKSLVERFDEQIESYKRADDNETQTRRDFLQSLDNWRIELAKNIALRNKSITEEELNFVVQNTIEAQSKLFHDRILPTLDNNIKSGNSLIDLDHYDSQLDFGEERKIKPFSWQEAFPEVFDRFVPREKKIDFKEQYQKLKIKDRFNVIQGIVSGLNKAYIYHKDEIPSIETNLLKTFVFGSDFEKYFVRNQNHQIIYLNRHIDIKKYPKTEDVLKPYKKQLDKRREVVNGAIPWYSLQWAREQLSFERPKILFQKIRNQKLTQRLVGTYDKNGLFVGDGVIFLNSRNDNKDELKFLLAILNSSLYNFYYRKQFLDINLKIKYLEETLAVDFTKIEKENAKKFTDMVKLVDQLLQLNKDLQTANLPTQIEQIQSRIAYGEDKINEIVYDLYWLTEKDIEIIEEVKN